LICFVFVCLFVCCCCCFFTIVWFIHCLELAQEEEEEEEQAEMERAKAAEYDAMDESEGEGGEEDISDAMAASIAAIDRAVETLQAKESGDKLAVVGGPGGDSQKMTTTTTVAVENQTSEVNSACEKNANPLVAIPESAAVSDSSSGLHLAVTSEKQQQTDSAQVTSRERENNSEHVQLKLESDALDDKPKEEAESPTTQGENVDKSDVHASDYENEKAYVMEDGEATTTAAVSHANSENNPNIVVDANNNLNSGDVEADAEITEGVQMACEFAVVADLPEDEPLSDAELASTLTKQQSMTIV
jgi:hypothetical protein